MKAPDFWNHISGPEAKRALRTVLRPFGWLYAKAAARRIQTTRPYDPGVPVICVGNATLGGTGKTPIVAYLLTSLRRMGVNAQGLSRGYGGREKGPVTVEPDHSAAQVGDEPLLLSRHCLLYTSPSPRDATLSRMPSSA